MLHLFATTQRHTTWDKANLLLLQPKIPFNGDYTPLVARDSESEGPQVCWQEFRQTRFRNVPRVYECYWAHFAAEIHLSE